MYHLKRKENEYELEPDYEFERIRNYEEKEIIRQEYEK